MTNFLDEVKSYRLIVVNLRDPSLIHLNPIAYEKYEGWIHSGSSESTYLIYTNLRMYGG